MAKHEPVAILPRGAGRIIGAVANGFIFSGVKPLRYALARIMITAFGLWLADILVDGVHVDGAGPLFLAAVLLGVVNAVVRPVVVFLTFPVTLVTLGLFLFVVNGAMIALVAWIIPPFHVDGLAHAILAAVIVGVTGWLANGYVGDGGLRVWTARRAPR